MASKKGFIIYADMLNSIEPLSMQERGELFTALLCDQGGKKMPDMSAAAKVAFLFVKRSVDANNEKYNRISEARREAGKKGGRPKQEKANESKIKQNEANESNNKANESNGKAKKPDNGEQITENGERRTDNGEQITENGYIKSVSAREEKPKPVKHKYGEYNNVLLTDDELEKLKIEFPTDWEERIDNLSRGIASKGYKYKSHYATIRVWARKDEERGYKSTGASVTKNKGAEELDSFYSMISSWAAGGEDK